MRILTSILLILLLALPADAGRRRKSRAKGKGKAVRVVPARQSCPPCIQQTNCPDKVIVSTQAEQEAVENRRVRSRQDFERDFAEWLARQPNMSPAAASVLRETARVWYGRGKGEQLDR